MKQQVDAIFDGPIAEGRPPYRKAAQGTASGKPRFEGASSKNHMDFMKHCNRPQEGLLQLDAPSLKKAIDKVRPLLEVTRKIVRQQGGSLSDGKGVPAERESTVH